MDPIIAAEYDTELIHLDNAATGLIPARAAAAVREALDGLTGRRAIGASQHEAVAAAREAFARIEGVPADRVAVGSSVSVHVALVAGSLPAGAEVLVADGDFSSLVNPFAVRRDLRMRSVPLERMAEEVREGTALVAVSSVQFTDGRLTDLDAIGKAARAHGARTLVDTTQGTGWRPPAAADFDVTVCGAYKWLLCPRGASFLTVSQEAQEWLTAANAGWMGGEVPGQSTVGVVRLADTARRYDQSAPFLPYIAGQHSLAMLADLGHERVGAHNTALADRFRAGLVALGHEPLPAPGSAIVTTPALAHAVPALAAAGITASDRGGLRCGFHVYNTEANVDRALEVLSAGA
ncbi:aminotransferase class V-fold PLP-dependent enzyme [Streptomyces sp. NPDC051940]|uniref:aminotransferase class V-fold PLP-dependent enzyme n=1 Tax=Streptomyces sp. NPDC051940 TaxID=3155675 RepID=UPI00341966B1